ATCVQGVRCAKSLYFSFIFQRIVGARTKFSAKVKFRKHRNLLSLSCGAAHINGWIKRLKFFASVFVQAR
ncbi:hypothetical protein, partial [Alkalimarinus sediminis]|uniref:hypothetical protein n=1 Tax=Alkalimarinus sediminis TaxID=1632866 RepID=UPI002044CD5F